MSLLARAGFALALVLAVAACESRLTTHGHVPHAAGQPTIEPGVHDRDEVASLLGTPSVVAALDRETWVYVIQTREDFAFLETEITDQQVLVIAFDDSGVVQGLERYGLRNGYPVDPVARTTPSGYGQEISLMQQLLGNLGRFSSTGR